MANENYDSVNDLITRHLTRETSASEEKELLSWISRSEENKRHFNAMKRAFELADQHFADTFSEDLPIDLDTEWDHFTESIGEAKKTRQLSTSRMWLRIAASFLLVAVTGAVLYYIGRPETVIYQTASSKEAVTLPDGSTITLNRFTSLTCDPGFGDKNRTVNLKGEAFFDVQPDASRPFVVITEKARVQVLGTSFNVNAYDSLQEVEVIVETGIVTLQSNQGDQKVELTAGQKGIYSKANEHVSSVINSDVNFLSWNTQRMVFVESDLRTVLETLKKTYNAQIVISADIPASCLVTVTFEHQTLASVLKVLESTLNLKYTITGNKVEITEAGC